MSRLTSFGRLNIKGVLKIRKFSTEVIRTSGVSEINGLPVISVTSNVKSEVKYPPIVDLSYSSRRKDRFQEKCDAVKRCPTVEEKFIKLNMPRYYGWRTFMLNHGELPIQSLTPIQHFTKTQIVVKDALPDFYLPIASAAEYHAQQLRPLIEEIIVSEFQGVRRNYKYDENISEKKQYDFFISQSIVRQLNRVILNYLSNNVPHLMECQVDFDPRIEAFWFSGGMDPPANIIYRRRTEKRKQQFIDEPYDRALQYMGKPLLTLRSELPLEPLLTDTELDNLEYNVPFNKYEPLALGFTDVRRHGTCIPGFWPGDKSEFGLISFYPREYMVETPPSYSEEENVENLHCNGILSSYSWAYSQACYQGFSTFNDMTYPLTAQTVITNGQYWSFYAYQLNTIFFMKENIRDETVKNVCFATNPMKLFEGIAGDGKVVGFNDDVLKILLQFYLNAPKQRIDTNMKPYLDSKRMLVSQIAGNEKRIWLENRFKFIFSNRPRHQLPPEMYDWERIYKYKFKTRPMDAKRRYFELGLDRINKPMDAYTPEYVPKALRTGALVNRKRALTYFPYY